MTRRLKRVMDVTLALGALIVLSPIILAAALAVLMFEGRPILFRQKRPGLHGVSFELRKFRTMRDDIFDADGKPDTSGKRTTRLGHILRKTSIDELPELVNVLKGEMSIVGPRPLLVEYLDRYTPEQARRHDVKPGITGLAQIRGRHLLEWDQRFELDVWYVDHWSLALDLEIIRATVRQVLFGKGIPPRGTPDYYFHGSAATSGGDGTAQGAGDAAPGEGTSAS